MKIKLIERFVISSVCGSGYCGGGSGGPFCVYSNLWWWILVQCNRGDNNIYVGVGAVEVVVV